MRDGCFIAVFSRLRLSPHPAVLAPSDEAGANFRKKARFHQLVDWHLPETADSEPSEGPRLEMLAFLSTTLCIPGRRRPSVYLATTL